MPVRLSCASLVRYQPVISGGAVMRDYLKKHGWKIGLAGIGLPVAVYLVLCISIGMGVNGAVSDAQARYPGDPVSSLISVAASEDESYPDRNRAVWALGQLGSSRALPILRALESGEPCDHESALCRHELEKAIEGCSGGTNIGAVVWRHGELAGERP